MRCTSSCPERGIPSTGRCATWGSLWAAQRSLPPGTCTAPRSALKPVFVCKISRLGLAAFKRPLDHVRLKLWPCKMWICRCRVHLLSATCFKKKINKHSTTASHTSRCVSLCLMYNFFFNKNLHACFHKSKISLKCLFLFHHSNVHFFLSLADGAVVLVWSSFSLPKIALWTSPTACLASYFTLCRWALVSLTLSCKLQSSAECRQG